MTASTPRPSPLLEAARAAIRLRYGEQPCAGRAAQSVDAGNVASWNPVLDTLLAHRSVRAFRPDPLPPHLLPWLVAAAQSAPSSSNLQTWSVVVVEDAGRRQRLAALVGNQRHVEEAPLLLVWLVDLSRLQRVAEAAGRTIEGPQYLDTFLMGAIDAALAAQNALVGAESLGLGSVYIGAMRNRPEEVAAELGLPPQVHAVFGHCIGWPDEARPAYVKPRLAPEAVLSRERYQPAPPEAIAEYDQALQAYFAAQGIAHPAWSTQVLDRLRDPAALKGRHRLVEALHGQGFELR